MHMYKCNKETYIGICNAQETEAKRKYKAICLVICALKK